MKTAILVRHYSVSFLASFFLCTLAHVNAASLETELAIGVGAQHSDNISRSNTNPRSDVESRISFDLGVNGATEQVDADVGYSFIVRDFKNDIQPDDEIVSGDATLLWTPLPERFAWEVTHTASDTVRNARLADTAENRQQRNIFSTGPNITFRLSPVDLVSAEVRFAKVKFENSNNDNSDLNNTQFGRDSDSKRLIGRVGWTHTLSAVGDLLANAEYEDVDAETNGDVTFTRFLVGYGARLRNGSYQILIGSNKVDRQAGEDVDAGALQVEFVHNFGGHELNLTMVKETTDTSVGFGTNNLRGDTFNPRDTNFDTFSVVDRSRADIVYLNAIICGGCSVRMSTFFDDQDYKDPPDTLPGGATNLQGDQRSYGVSALFAYQLSRNLELVVDGTYDTTEFVDDVDGLEFDSSDYGLGLNYSAFRDFSIGLLVRKTERDANIDDFNYEELRGGIEFRYVF